MTQNKLSVTLFRFLLKGTKDCLNRKNKEFYHNMLNLFYNDIVKFTDGEKLYNRLGRIPTRALKLAFREGNKQDLTSLIGLLPTLLRYFRSMKILNNEIKKPQRISLNTNSLPTIYNLAPGALLISKLYYPDAKLKERCIEQLFDTSIEKIIKQTEEQMQELFKFYTKNKFRYIDYHSNVKFDQSIHKLIYLLYALDTVITQNETKRRKGSYYYHLVDQILAPEKPFDRGSSIAYASIYSTLINKLGMEIESFGVSFYDNFLLRVFLKNPKSIYHSFIPIEHKEPDNFSCLDDNVSKQEITSVELSDILGYWIYISPKYNFREVTVSFDSATHSLTAFLMPLYDHESSVKLWQLNLKETHTDISGTLQCKENYYGELVVNELDGKVIPCVVRFKALSSSVFEKWKRGVPILENKTYIEIQIMYNEPLNIDSSDEPSGEFEDSPSSLLRNIYMCPRNNFDLCLFDFSELGIIPITPIQYLESLINNGHTFNDIPEIISPATNLQVSCELAGEIAGEPVEFDTKSDFVYWSFIKKYLLTKANEEKKFIENRHK